MLIKLECRHCGEVIEVEEINLIQEPEMYRNCSLCSYKMEVMNLDELIKFDVETQIKMNINKWLKELGGDETLSLIQRNKNQACYRLYKEEMIKRGFIVK
jgi:hypothetical protein